MDAVVKNVYKDSIADEIGILPGDILKSINDKPLMDILDYKFLSTNCEYTVEILKTNGETEIIEIENPDYEEFGVEFTNPIIDKEKWCQNKCMFCFVDQLPKNMRKTLYYKDDDYRLSTLMGNYITLTNLKENDIKRIVDMHLPRLNVSVHAVDKELRSKLIGNKNGDILPLLKRFCDAKIFMNCQVVLCKNLNDGKYLDDTINELAKLYPYVQSLSVVPVGLTEHREGLNILERFDNISAEAVINQVETHSNRLKKEIGTNFVFASDEFYVKANHKIPDVSHYESFLQIENGVGLLSTLFDEFNNAKSYDVKTKKTIATGVSAAPYIKMLVDSVTDKVQVIPITNNFLGKTITVAGLLTGKDIIDQLKDKDLGEFLILPDIMLNYDQLFLDNMKVSDVEKALNIKVKTVPNDGAELKRIIGG